MKKLIAVTVATLLTAGAASAADLKAPIYKAPPLVPAYNWTGFYAGVNVGLGVGEHATNYSVLPGFSFNNVTGAPFGAIGGVQAGYNYQIGNWVLGLEADIQASGQSQDANCLLLFCGTGAQSASIEQKLSWFGTARARIGYTSTSGVMAYYTGGFAFGDVETTVNEAVAGTSGAFTFSDTKTGWTLGAGIEAALGGNWTGKLEYLYLDLGEVDGTYTFVAPRRITHDVNSHIFRAGLNYRFGGAIMAPLPLANWSGFYVGANVGSAYSRTENSLLIPGLAPGVNEQFTSAPNGFIGGAQIGYNWQASNWVFGLEADFQGSTQKDTVCALLCSTPAGGLFAVEQQLPWFGTVRGRVGYATGPTLFYVTGGLAYGKVESDALELFNATLVSHNFSETKTGWTLGGGVERPFDFFGLLGGPNWSIKGEYLYVDLGEVTNSYVQGGLPQTFSSDVTSHIFRTGINYRFGAAPVIAKY